MTIEDLFSHQATDDVALVDVRSPGEFAEYNVPGSINIPIFDNEERARIGTLYRQSGQAVAEEAGLQIFSAKLPTFIAAFKSLPPEKVVYCWRGGMRSKTAATVLDLMGHTVFKLTGGIRSYREWVVHTLDQEQFTPKLYVLNGCTGSGKTILLKRLKEQGYPIIDFEGMANHRGSIFGQIGLQPHKQKKFDAFLVEEMVRHQDAPFVLIEGEGKRIGKVVLPDFLFKKKEQSVQLVIHLPLEVRVQNIFKEYQPLEHKAAFIEAFNIIKRRIHTPIAKQISDDLQHDNFESAVKLMLEYYYDPMYEHAIANYPQTNIRSIVAETLDEAAVRLTQIIQQEEAEIQVLNDIGI